LKVIVDVDGDRPIQRGRCDGAGIERALPRAASMRVVPRSAICASPLLGAGFFVFLA
jgi:hypothetical protein